MTTPAYEIRQGNILHLAPQMVAARRLVHAIICSPPYYGLRDYSTDPQVWDGDPACSHAWQGFTKKGQSGGTKSKKVQTKGTENFQIVPDKEQAACSKCGAWRGELGQEPTPDDFIRHLVQIFEALKPLLHTSGTLWVNLGDSFAKGKEPGLKAKDLMGIPWMFAFAMRQAGWYLRADIIWAKRNPMPESVTDRPTKAHEYIFLFSKSESYYFDHLAAQETTKNGGGRNMRSVQWEDTFTDVIDLATKPYPGAHFATWPPALAERMIKAATSEKGVCPACSEPWRAILERTANYGLDAEGYPKTKDLTGHNGHQRLHARLKASRKAGANHDDGLSIALVKTGRWEPGCACNQEPIPATVLDPFTGSGTTLFVARSLGRASLGFELNPSYIDLAQERMAESGADYSTLPLFQTQLPIDGR